MDHRYPAGYNEHSYFKVAIMSTNTQRLVILGAAESGVGAALLGRQQGWDVFVSDGGKIKEHFKEALQQQGVAFEEGGHTMENILNANCIVKSPGISDKVAVMKQVRAAGIEVCSEIEFARAPRPSSLIICCKRVALMWPWWAT